MSDFSKLLSDVLVENTFREMVHIYALSAALDEPIQLYYPPQIKTELSSAFTRLVVGHSVQNDKTPQIMLMWSSAIAPSNMISFKANHFVSLLPKNLENDKENNTYLCIKSETLYENYPLHDSESFPNAYSCESQDEPVTLSNISMRDLVTGTSSESQPSEILPKSSSTNNVCNASNNTRALGNNTVSATSSDINSEQLSDVLAKSGDDSMSESVNHDTEDASETDVAKQETQYTEIKEQMYQDKLAFLKKQLKQLEDGTLPEFLKRNKKIDQQYRERLKLMEVFKEYELEVIDREYKKEKKLSVKEFEEKKIDLKESLIADLEDKKRSIETERSQLELTGGHCNFLLSTSLDPVEVKPISTRKLRRRPNDPVPIPEKRRKPSPDILSQINFYLEDNEIMDDLRIINKVSGKPLGRKPIPTIGPVDIVSDVKIDDGRLYYDKRWFHRNQPVFVECKETGKFSGVITAIGTQEIWIRKTTDSSKIKVYLHQLQKGKYVLRRKQT